MSPTSTPASGGATIATRKFKPSKAASTDAPDEWDVSDEEPEPVPAAAAAPAASHAGPSGAASSSASARGSGKQSSVTAAVEEPWGPTPGEASRITAFVPARRGPLDEWEAA